MAEPAYFSGAPAFRQAYFSGIWDSAGVKALPSDWRKAAVAVVLSIAAATAIVLLLDCWIFRSHLEPRYVAFYTSPLMPRAVLMCIMAVLEEIKFRLLAMTALLVVARMLLRRTPPPWCVFVVIVVAQFANVGALVVHDPVYASLRYLLVGSIWGWLYWKHGWAAAVIGHGSTHLLLDPLLLYGLR